MVSWEKNYIHVWLKFLVHWTKNMQYYPGVVIHINITGGRQDG